jgi:hypothetical protein
MQRVKHIPELYYVPAFLYYFHFKCMYSKRIILKVPMCRLATILKDVDAKEGTEGVERGSADTGRGPVSGSLMYGNKSWVTSEFLNHLSYYCLVKTYNVTCSR